MKNQKVKVQNAAGEEREVTGVQWNLIGSDPKTNGGWKPVAPAEATKAAEGSRNPDGGSDDEAALIQATRLEYKEVTGESAGNKGLARLQEEIAAKRAADAEAAAKVANA